MADEGDFSADVNCVAIEAISNKLADVTGLAEQLDNALCGSETLATAATSGSSINKLALDGTSDAEWYASALAKTNGVVSKSSTGGSTSSSSNGGNGMGTEDGSKSEEEFVTASECTCTPPSRSSSFHTASEGEATSPWWEPDPDADEQAKDEAESPEEGVTNVIKNIVVTETHHLTLSHKTEDFDLPSSLTVKNKQKCSTNGTDETRVEDDENANGGEMLSPIENGIPIELACGGKTESGHDINKEEIPDINDNTVRDIKETKDWLELKVLELTPALTLLGVTLQEATDLQIAHDDVLLKIQSKQSPVQELLRQADQLITGQKARADVYAAMADSLALAWRDVNTQLQRRKTILDLNVKYHSNASICLERTKALEIAAGSGAPLPVEVSAIQDMLNRLNQTRRSMLESLMLALQDGRALLEELQAVAQEGTLDSRPDHIRTAANCAVSQVEHWLENLHDRRRLLEASYHERKGQLEQCLALALLTVDLRQLEHILDKRMESLVCSRDELGDSDASSQLLLHEHRKLMPEAKDLQEQGVKILRATEQLAASGHFAGEEAMAQAYHLLDTATEYIEAIEIRDNLLIKANAFFRAAQSAITKLDQLEVQLNTADFTVSSQQLAALHGNIARAIDNATDVALQEGYALLEAAPGAENVKRTVEEIESRKIQLNVRCVANSEKNIKASKALNNFLEKQTQLYSWLVSTAQSFIQGHQDMGSVLAMAKDFQQLHNRMLNELQVKSTEINALLSTLPGTLELLDADSQLDCEHKAEELVVQCGQLKEILERRTELARTYVKFHSLAVELATEMDALDNVLHSPNLSSAALNNAKQKWFNAQQLYLQLVNTGTNFTEDSYMVGDPYLDVERARLCVSTLTEHFSSRKTALTSRWSDCEQVVSRQQQTALLWERNMADTAQTVDWVSKLDARLYPAMNEETTDALQMARVIEHKLNTVLPEVKRALAEVQLRIKTANELIGTGEVPNRDDSVLAKLKELEDKLQIMITEYQILLEMLISFFKNLSELERTALDRMKSTGELEHKMSMESVDHLIKDHDASRQAVSELFRFTHAESQQIIEKIKQQEPEPARERDIGTVRRMVEDKRSSWERAWTERRLDLEQSQQLCQFDTDLEHIYNNIDQLERQLIAVRGQYGESLASAKATSLTFLYFEKTITLLQQRIETFVSAAEVMSNSGGSRTAHVQDEVSRLRKRWEEFEKQVMESRRLIDLSIQFFTLVEEAEEWFREGSRLLVTIARRSSVSRTPEDATELLNELEMFFKPGESLQDERINKIADLAEQLFVGEARPPAQVIQVREESREMKDSFQQVSRELRSLLESHRQQQLEKMDVQQSDPVVVPKHEHHKTVISTTTEQTIVEVIESGSVVRKHKSPSPPPKKAKYQEETAAIADPPSPPQFIQPLSDTVIDEGNKFTFNCRVNGRPQPSVSWMKDGISIENNPDYQTKFDDGLCSLTIEETFAEDSARFTCRAVNSAGTAETTSQLIVKECEPEVDMIGPLFIQPLLSVTGVEGSACAMTCHVDGNPLPTVQWFKGDVCIDHNSDYSITFNNGLAVMRIENLSPGDQAQYTCKASNKVTSDSSTAWLFVKPKESQEVPKFTIPLSTNVMARAGQKIKLDCQVTGKPAPTVSWLFNGKPVKESKDQVQVHYENGNATLVISEAFPKDAGTYSVTAVNPAGEASESCQVSVKGILPTETSDSEHTSDIEPIKPSIQLQLKDSAVFEGMKVKLECVIVGQPEPEVIWYHEDRPVKESADFQLLFHGDRCSLIIQEAYLEDAGEYKVVAINSAGEASSRCKLTVQSVGGTDLKGATRQTIDIAEGIKGETATSVPRFTQLLTDVLVPIGENTKLECTVDGKPLPVVSWLHNSRSVVASDRIKLDQTEDGRCTLYIYSVTPEDKGNYTALVQSPMGEAKCFAHLIVKGSTADQETEINVKHDDRPVQPSFAELFADTVVCEGEPAKFECIVVGKPMPKVRWLFNDKPVAGKELLVSTSGPRQVLSIPLVTRDTAGQITCVAENEAGKAACTAKLQISNAPIDLLLPTLENVKLSETGGLEMRREVVTESTSSRVYRGGTTITTSGTTTVVGDQQPTVQIQSVSTRSELASHKIGDDPVVQVERHQTMEFQQKDGIVSEQKTDVKSKTIGGATSTDKTTTNAIQPVKRKQIPPNFSSPVMGKIVDQGVDVTLEGIVDGFPQPDVKWTKNGDQIVAGPNVQISQDLNRVKLFLSNVGSVHAGRYTCTASNPAGTASCTADLVVKKSVFPPVMGRRLQASARTVGDRIVMEIEVTGTPDPEVTWFKDGQRIPASSSMFELRNYGNSHALVIEKATLSHTGQYSVSAVNSGGEAKSTADLLVQQPQIPIDILEQTTTNVSSSHEVIRHPEQMKAINNSSTQFFESIQKGSQHEHHQKTLKTGGPVGIEKDAISKDILPGESVSVIETVKTDKQVSIKLSHSSGTSTWSDEKFELSSHGKKTPIPIIESPLPFHPPKPYIKEEITTAKPEILKEEFVPFMEKTMDVVEETSTIEDTSITKKDALKFFKHIINENKQEEEKLQQQMTKAPYVPEMQHAPAKETLFNKEYFQSDQSSFTSVDQHWNAQSPYMEMFDLEPGPPPEMGFIPKATVVVKKDDVVDRVKKLEESHRTLSDEEIPSGAIRIFPSPIKKEAPKPPVQAAPAAPSPVFSPSKFEKKFEPKTEVQPKRNEVVEEVIVPQKVELAGSDEKTVIKTSHFLESSSKFESTLSPVYRPQAEIDVRPQSPRPSAEAVSMEKLWTTRQKDSVDVAHNPKPEPIQKPTWKPPPPEPVQPAWKPAAPEPIQQPSWNPSPEPVQLPAWKPVTPEPFQLPTRKPVAPEPVPQPPWTARPSEPIQQPARKPAPPEPVPQPPWAARPSEPIQQPARKPAPPEPASQPPWMAHQPEPVQQPAWQPAQPEPTWRPTSPLPSAEGVAMEKLWSHKHSESSLKTVWPPPLPSELKQQAPWVEKIKTDLSQPVMEVQTKKVEKGSFVKEQKSFSSKQSFTENISFKSESFDSQTKTQKSEFVGPTNQVRPVSAPIFQKPVPPPPVDSPKIIYVAEAHATHSSNLPLQQETSETILTTSNSEFSSLSKSEFSETIQDSSSVVEEKTLKPSQAKALWDSGPKTQDIPAPTPKKTFQPKKQPPRPYSAQELNFDDIRLEPGPPPEMGFAKPPVLERRQSQVEIIEQDLEKDLEKEPSRQLVGAVRIIPPPKKEKSVERTVNTFQQNSYMKQSKAVEFKRSTSLDKDSKPLELEPFPFKPGVEKPRPKVFGTVPKPSKFVKKSCTESDYESDFDQTRIPPIWTPYESDSEGPTYRKVNPPNAKSQPKRPHSVAAAYNVVPPTQFEQPRALLGPTTTIQPQKQHVVETKSQQVKVEEHQSKNTVMKQFQSSVERTSAFSSSSQTTAPIVPEPVKSPEVEKPKQESPKSKQKIIKTTAPESGYMADTDEPRHQSLATTVSQSSHTSHSYHQSQQSFSSSSTKTSSQQQSSWKQQSSPSVPTTVNAAFKKESVSSQIVEQNKLLSTDHHQQQSTRPTKRSVGPPPPSPSKFVKGDFRESDYESDYEGRIPVRWRPPHDSSDVENTEFRPVHPVLSVSKHSSSKHEARLPTPPSAFDVPPQTSSFVKTNAMENSQLIKPKALTAVPVQQPVAPPALVGFQLKPGSPPKMDFAPPPSNYYKIPSGTQLETSNSMSFAESTESSKRVVNMQQTTRVIKFDEGKRTKKSVIIKPVGSDYESDYDSSSKVRTSWPPENPLQFEAEQKRLQRVEEMRRRFSDKTATPPTLTPGEPPQYGFIEPNRTTEQTSVDASSIASKHMSEMTNSFKSTAQKFASDVMTDVQSSKKNEVKRTVVDTKSAKPVDDPQAYREESRLSEYGTKQIDPETGLIYFKYDFGYEFGVVLPGEGGKKGAAAIKGTEKSRGKQENLEESVPVPVIHESTKKTLSSDTKRLSSKSVKWEQTSESEMSDTGIDVTRRKRQQQQQQQSPHILIPQTPTPQSLSPSLHSLSPYLTPGHDSTVSPGSSFASGLSPGGVATSGASPVVNPSTVPEHCRKAPQFITPLRDIAVLTGNAARFECIVQAEPLPNILWAHDGRILQPSEQHNIQFRNGVCRLTMPKAELFDGGWYTCTATNLLGTSGTSASLQVSGERRSLLV